MTESPRSIDARSEQCAFGAAEAVRVRDGLEVRSDVIGVGREYSQMRAYPEQARMLSRALRAMAMAAGIILLFSPNDIHGQSSAFASVLVHGGGLTEPVLIDDPGVAACLWGFTYNFYSTRTTQPQPGLPAVTLSFFTRDVWTELVANSTYSVESVTSARATFHTRIFLAPLGAEAMPHVQFKKPRDSTFISRMTLLEAAEPFLAGYGIPTRVSAAGDPIVRQFPLQDIEAARAELSGMFGTRMPVCAAIRSGG